MEDDGNIYETVEQMVIWGEEREEVFRMLEVNGIPQAQAEGLYKKAMKERIAAIRSDCWKSISFGVGCLLAGLGVWGLFSIRLGLISRGIFLICAASFVFGFWKLLDGVAGMMLASRKRGPLSDGL